MANSTQKTDAPVGREARSLSTLWAELRRQYPGLRLPSDAQQQALEKELTTYRRERETTAQIIAGISVTFLLLSFPILAAWAYRITAPVHRALLLHLEQGVYFREHPAVM